MKICVTIITVLRVWGYGDERRYKLPCVFHQWWAQIIKIINPICKLMTGKDSRIWQCVWPLNFILTLVLHFHLLQTEGRTKHHYTSSRRYLWFRFLTEEYAGFVKPHYKLICKLIWPFYALQQAIQIPAKGVKIPDQFSMTSVLFFSVIQ